MLSGYVDKKKKLYIFYMYYILQIQTNSKNYIEVVKQINQLSGLKTTPNNSRVYRNALIQL
jgi:hypothetical protein